MSAKVNKLITKIESPTLEAFGHALAGATAGAFALCILYPLDQIKVRKAVQSQSRILSFGIILDDFIHLRIENIMDIYRGLSFGILEQFSFNGVYFFFYQILKSDWKRKYASISQPEMPWMTSLIRGSMAGLLTQIFTTPLKVIQLRKQTAANESESQLTNILSSIYDNNGMTGFWSGMKASVILVVNPAIVQLLYGKIRTYLISKFGVKSALIDFFCGALSKAIATIICYPLVMIKMNLQAGSDSSSPTPSPRVGSPLSKSPRFAYKGYEGYQNGIKSITEGHEESKKMESIDDVNTNDNEFNIDIDADEDSGEEKNASSLDKKKKEFYHGIGSLKSPTSPKRRTSSMSDIFESTIREKGIFGLYAGLGPKLVHASLSNAITFASKEKFVVYTFAMMLYLIRLKEQKLQKMKRTSNIITK